MAWGQSPPIYPSTLHPTPPSILSREKGRNGGRESREIEGWKKCRVLSGGGGGGDQGMSPPPPKKTCSPPSPPNNMGNYTGINNTPGMVYGC